RDIADKTKPLPDSKDPEKYLEELYETCVGTCRHRVAAAYAKIVNTYPHLKDLVRIVCIDNNHVRLEINNDGQWLQVDLGGGEAINKPDMSGKPYEGETLSDIAPKKILKSKAKLKTATEEKS